MKVIILPLVSTLFLLLVAVNVVACNIGAGVGSAVFMGTDEATETGFAGFAGFAGGAGATFIGFGGAAGFDEEATFPLFALSNCLLNRNHFNASVVFPSRRN